MTMTTCTGTPAQLLYRSEKGGPADRWGAAVSKRSGEPASGLTRDVRETPTASTGPPVADPPEVGRDHVGLASGEPDDYHGSRAAIARTAMTAMTAATTARTVAAGISATLAMDAATW